MRISWFVLLAALASAAFGYEFFLKSGQAGAPRLGDPIDRAGSERGTGSPPIEVYLNTLRLDDSDRNGTADTTSPLAAASLAKMTQQVMAAVELYNQVPGTNLRLVVKGTLASSTIKNVRPYLLVSAGALPLTHSAIAWTKQTSGQHYALGLHLNVQHLDTPIMALALVHELGHCLGLQNSSCDRQLTNHESFGYTNSGGAFLSGLSSYGRQSLHEDDQAALRALYPDQQAATDFGGIKGELLDAAHRPLFGGNMIVVDAGNRAVVARLSGLSEWTGEKRLHGRFVVAGLAPGTYTVVGASMRDPNFRIGDRVRYPFDTDYDDHAWAPAIRTGVVVKAGEATDLGDLVEGSHEAQASDETLIRWQPVAGASGYKIYLYKQATKVWEIQGKRYDGTELRIALDAGEYKLTVRAIVGSSTVISETRVFAVGPSTPLLLDAPALVEGIAGLPLTIPFSASDPDGGTITISATNMPSGMLLQARALEWANPAVSDFFLILTVRSDTNAREMTAPVQIRIAAPLTHSIRLAWSRLAGEQLYRIRAYDRDGAVWLPPIETTDDHLDLDLQARRFRFHFYQRAQGKWVKISEKEHSVAAAATVVLWNGAGASPDPTADLRSHLDQWYADHGADATGSGGNGLAQAKAAVKPEQFQELTDPEDDPHAHDLGQVRVFRHQDVVWPGSDIVWFVVYDRATGAFIEAYDFN